MNARLLACAAALSVTAVALTGCSLPGATHATGKKGLEHTLAAFADTSKVEVYAENGSIWKGFGPAHGSVALKRGTPSHVKSVVDAVGTFLASERGASVDWDAVSVSTSVADLEVRDRRDVNDEERRALAVVSSDPDIDYADIDRSFYATVDGDDVIAPFERLEARLAAYHEVGSQGLEVDSDDADGAFSIYMYDVQSPPDDEIAAFHTIAQRFTPRGVKIRRSSVQIALPASQVAKARKALAALGPYRGVTVSVVPADSAAPDETP